ncbi:ComF family protein [Pseudoxanthomonas sp. 10H]|uniref:ComF family protein n=1 Tax=Pseudoxanthomonas sp. 10H TaxID=3242729 RepID=UPI0035569BB3
MPAARAGRPLDVLSRLAGRILPRRCLACEEPGGSGLDLCPACLEGLPVQRAACLRCAVPLATAGTCGRCLQHPPPLAAAHAALLYAAPMDRLVPRFKFHRDLAAGRLLAQLMAHAFAGCDRPQALVPVVLHQRRLRGRGYDQALELARPLAAILRLPLRTDLLRRVRDTPAQSQLDAAARRRNLRGAFEVAGGDLPAHVALVDDVMTTGATLHAAAIALRRAGVARVDAWVCARVP